MSTEPNTDGPWESPNPEARIKQHPDAERRSHVIAVTLDGVLADHVSSEIGSPIPGSHEMMYELNKVAWIVVSIDADIGYKRAREWLAYHEYVYDDIVVDDQPTAYIGCNAVFCDPLGTTMDENAIRLVQSHGVVLRRVKELLEHAEKRNG